MSRLAVSIATRDWDHLTPLLLGDVTSDLVDLRVTRLDTLLPAVREADAFDGVETSLSRYALLRAAQDDRVAGIANFVMRGFRHRCILVANYSPLTQLAMLRGGRIGVTGWHDSGNIWTRAALRDAGVGVEDAKWFVGRLTSAHPIADRLRGYGRAGRIEACPGDAPMLDLLTGGQLDAVCTPFWPEACYGANPPFRPLLSDFVDVERAAFARTGFVPGHHMITFRSDFARAHPWVLAEVSRLLDLSRQVWRMRRRKYAETSPWLIDELLRAARTLPDGADASGAAANRPMLAAFCDALLTQSIISTPLAVEALFDD